MLSFHGKICVILYSLVLPLLDSVAQSATQERGVVCIYYKRLNPSNSSEGFLMQLINKHTTSGKFILRTSSDPSKPVYVDLGRDLNPNERDIIERNLAARIGDMFIAKSDKSLKTLAQYKELLTLLESNNRVFQQIDLTKNFDIKDTVYLFDFDAAAQNYSIFKNDSSPEAIALYHFTHERWRDRHFYPDYKERISKYDFKEFLEPNIVSAIFQVPKASPETAVLNDAQKKLLRDADQKATWAMLLAVASLIAGLFGIFIELSQSKDRGELISRLEGKVKVLENRLNKPFYQSISSNSSNSDENKISLQQLQSVMNRLTALEKAIGLNTVPVNLPTEFKNDTAKKLLQLIQDYRQRWSANENLALVYASLSVCLNDFAFCLSALDRGMSTKDFVIQHAIPHIDAIDSVFQSEPDAPLNTPQSVNDYIIALQQVLNIKEIEVRPKVSHFDNKWHEKAGDILTTNLQAGTITKVLRRGLIYGEHEETIRKAQVIRAE